MFQRMLRGPLSLTLKTSTASCNAALLPSVSLLEDKLPKPSPAPALPGQTSSVAAPVFGGQKCPDSYMVQSWPLSCDPHLPPVPCQSCPAAAGQRTFWSQGSGYQIEFQATIVFEHSPHLSLRPLLKEQPFQGCTPSHWVACSPDLHHSTVAEGFSALWAHVFYMPH